MKDVSVLPSPSVGNTHVRELKTLWGGMVPASHPGESVCHRGMCVAIRNAFLGGDGALLSFTAFVPVSIQCHANLVKSVGVYGDLV